MTTQPTDEEIRAMAEHMEQCFIAEHHRGKLQDKCASMLRAWLAERQAMRDGVTDDLREIAIDIARRHAKAKPQSYYAEPFHPHEWVIDALMEVLSRQNIKIDLAAVERACRKHIPWWCDILRHQDHNYIRNAIYSIHSATPRRIK